MKEKSGITSKLYMICMTIVAIMALGTLVFYILCDNVNLKSGNLQNNIDSKNDDKNIDSTEELKNFIKDSMSQGKGTIEVLRKIYTEDIVVYNNNRFVFTPVDENLEKNNIDNEYINKLENGEIVYKEDDDIISVKGIDVSKYQGDIDWNKVASDGVKYAIIRIGYRGYGTGSILLDENAIKNIEGAIAAGIDVGVYFFSQAITREEAIEEAEFVLEKIKGYNITYPVVFDTEEVYAEDARADFLTKEERTDVAIAFCDVVKKAGYTPAIYANLKHFTLSLELERIEEYYKWFAYYDSELYFPYRIDMWQYSESGSVSGIDGQVDMNITFKR